VDTAVTAPAVSGAIPPADPARPGTRVARAAGGPSGAAQPIDTIDPQHLWRPDLRLYAAQQQAAERVLRDS
jgi:outer membrane protein TolC